MKKRSNVAALAAADALVTYTYDARPTDYQARALKEFVDGGGRWCALHATKRLQS